MTAIRLYFIAVLQIILAPFEILLGRRHKTYVTSTKIKASRHVVWDILTADDIEFEGWMPMRFQTHPHPDGSDKLIANITIGEQIFKLVLRILDQRPLEHMVMQVLADGSDREVMAGDNYFISKGLKEIGDDTQLVMSHELDHIGVFRHLFMPINVAQSALRISREAERRMAANATSERGQPPVRISEEAVRNAVVTGFLTFASFLMFFHWTSAAILLGLILIHEVGHVIAMRQMGHAVQGIYFVPFMGGLAVSQDSYADEGERGYIALMGPGFCVLTTAILLWLAHSNPQQPLLAHAAYMSALLNGFNLLPVLPLDGGNVTSALLSRNLGMREKVQMIVLVGAIGFCAMQRFWLGAFLAFSALISMQQHEDPAVTLLPISNRQRNWLWLAYVATFLFYVFASMSAAQVGYSYVPQDRRQHISEKMPENGNNVRPFQSGALNNDTPASQDDVTKLRCKNDERLVISTRSASGIKCIKD